jgi:hypothetical protein
MRDLHSYSFSIDLLAAERGSPISRIFLVAIARTLASPSVEPKNVLSRFSRQVVAAWSGNGFGRKFAANCLFRPKWRSPRTIRQVEFRTSAANCRFHQPDLSLTEFAIEPHDGEF